MSTIIEGQVAAIIDDTALVLNVGSRQGVRKGMIFVIFAVHQEIGDPVTGEALGHWEMVKAQVVVVHVQERMCTVRAPVVPEERVTDGTRPLSAMMVEHSLGQYGAREVEWQRLPVRTADLRGRPKVQPIGVGDGARAEVEDEAPQERAEARQESDVAQE